VRTFQLVFHCNYVPIFYRFWDIQRRIMAWPWIMGLGSFKVIESGTLQSLDYVRFLPVCHCNYGLSCTVVALFDIEQYHDIKIEARGHSRSLGILKLWYDFLFAFHSNFSRVFSRLDTIHECDSQPATARRHCAAKMQHKLPDQHTYKHTYQQPSHHLPYMKFISPT